MTWQTTNTAKGDNKLYSDAKGVVPSLDLRFASQKNLNDYMTGTPLVDHQRSMSGSNLSPGTFVNSNGLIETAKVNLVVYSEDFSVSSAWVPVGSTAVQSTTVLAPDNLSFTYKLEEDNTTGSHRFLSGTSNTVSATINLPYTISFFVKNAGRDYVFIRFNTGVGDFVTGSVRLSDATVTQTITGTITATPVGNGWVRIVGTGVSNATGSAYPEIRASNSAIYSNYTGDGTSGIYVWGAQVEEGTTATTYIPTTNVPSAAPRFDHDPTTGESLGLLVEESRTNYITNSTNFAASVLPVTATLNFAVSPDNTVSATRHQSASSDTGTIILSKSATPGEIYTLSVYAKRNSGSGNLKLLIYELPSVAATVQTFTLTNEWQRFSITRTVGANQTSIQCRIVGTPANYDNLYWGAQVEEGSFPTSYIPTTGTALTRSADVASITGSNFSSWYNQGEGTVFVKGATNDIDGNTGWASFYQASSPNNNRISVRQGPTLITSAGTTIGLSASSSPTPKEIQKISTAYKNDDFALYSTYSTPVLLSAGSLPVSVDTALFGGVEGTGGAFNLNGTIARLTYFPDRLEDSVLQAITQ